MPDHKFDADIGDKTPQATDGVQGNPKLSRRKLLASFGAAGAAVAAAEALGMGNTVFGKNSSVTDTVYKGSNGGPRLPDLRAMPFTVPMTITQLRGATDPQQDWVYYVTDRGKEGHFYYDATDAVTPDNTGTVLVSSSGARFKRIIENGTVNVQWFGAIGDGIADDAPALQAAIDAIPPEGGVLLIPPTQSFYALETHGLRIENRSNVIVFSSGAMLKFKDGVPDVKDPKFQYNFCNLLLRNCTHIRVEGVALHGNLSQRQAHAGSESFEHCLGVIHCDDISITHCTITEGMSDGIYIGGIYSGGPTTGTAALSTHVHIDFCTVTKCRRNNISIVAADGVTVSNCRVIDAGILQGTNPMFGIDVEPNTGWFGTCKNIVLRINSIENSYGSYGVSFGGSGHENVLVDGNRFAGNKTGLNFNNNAGAPDNSRVQVVNNIFTGNTNGMRLVQKNVDIVSGNLFSDNASVGLILFSVDGVQITHNTFIRNASYGISAGHRTDTSVQIRSAIISNNIFQDNAPQTAASASGYSVRLYVKDETAMVVFNNNVQHSSPSAPFKMKGVSLDKACIARANNNMSRNLFDNDNPHPGFTGVGNYSVDAAVPEL